MIVSILSITIDHECRLCQPCLLSTDRRPRDTIESFDLDVLDLDSEGQTKAGFPIFSGSD